MKKSLKKIGFAMACVMVMQGFTAAEVAGPYSVGFNLNFPTTAGKTSEALKNGFGFGFDMGYRPETSPLGIRLDVSHSSFDLSSAVLKNIDRADTGWATVWGFDLSALLTPRHAKTIRPYIQAGPGIYYEHAEASRFSGSGGVVCDPWYGCWNVSNTTDVADKSTWRVGLMGGAGLNIEFDGGGALFLQAQYHVVENTNLNIEMIPIAMGYRQSF